METIIAFGCGAVTMFFIGMFVVVVQLRNQVKQLSLTNQNLEGYITDVSKGVEDSNSMIHQRIDSDVNELYRQFDSRFDKLENKLTNQIDLKQDKKV